MSGEESLPVLIVDAYNVIAHDPTYRMLFDSDADTGRARLVDDVASHSAGRFRATVVFDAHANPIADGQPHEIAGVVVVFSPAGVEADAVIESLAHAGRRAGDTVVVVTSDGETRRAVARPGTRIWSAGEFVSAMRETRSEESRAGESRTLSPLEDRIDADTREALMRWARS